MITRISSSQPVGNAGSPGRYLESEERAVSVISMSKNKSAAKEMSPLTKSILTVLCSMAFMTGFIFLSGLFKSHK